MNQIRGMSGVGRVVFWALATVAVLLISSSFALLIIGPTANWPIALIGVVCAGALEVFWLRVGSVRHRTPIISVPVLALPALALAITPEAAVGLISLGVLLVILLRTWNFAIALYSAGLAGAASVVSGALALWLVAMGLPTFVAWGIACAGSVAFIVVVEVLRRRFAKVPLDLGGRSMISPSRTALVLVGAALVGALAARWTEQGLPLLDENSVPLNAIVVLLGLTAASAALKLPVRIVLMRRRLSGLIAGTRALSSSNRLARRDAERGKTAPLSDDEAAARLGRKLCRVVAETIGAESVVVRDEPPTSIEIGVPVSLTIGSLQFVVARRDVMDGAFSVDDLHALGALAHTADGEAQERLDIGGLTIRANTDPLTGLPNYGAFQDALANINDHRDYSEALAVLFIDLDDFKHLNDRHGHQVGDEVLRELGRRFSAVVRPDDVVARVGGDEFVIILTQLSSLAESKLITERIMVAASQPLTLGQQTFTPVLSIGLAYSAHRETDVKQLVQDADRSMLAIKKSKNRGGPAKESSISISAHRSSEMNDIVGRAVDENLLELAFQPIVNLVTGRIWAFEALVRYTHPELGPISPSSLVEKAKGLGRMDKLTRQVAEKAMAAAAEFRAIDPHIACMAINIEAGQVLPNRVGTYVAELAARYPEIKICLELNERSLARVSTAVRAQTDHLRDIGLLIALDDYGSRDSSVDSLVRMPMDILKIDRSLVNDLNDVRQREVLTALQSFGDSLEYSMIVEGVENQDMADHLNALGIRNAQGFHYGIPQSLDSTLARLRGFGAAAVLPETVSPAPAASLTGALSTAGVPSS